jgi:diguanylate cyclase (GGDEF)-like protein
MLDAAELSVAEAATFAEAEAEAATDALALSHEALVQFLHRIPLGLIQTALDGEIEMINPMSVQLLMPLCADGGLLNLFTAIESVVPQLRGLVAAFERPSGIVCESMRIPLASQVLSMSLLKLDSSRLMAVLNDATLDVRREQQSLATQLLDRARIDVLTQLPNRAAARERIQSALRRAPDVAGREFALLFINCDRFKQINDSQGHPVGDEILALMAERLRGALRTVPRQGGNEAMAARTGGDEFVVLLDDLRHAEDAHLVAQRLIDVFSKPYGIGQAQLHCTVSMGVVLQAQAGQSADAALRDASIAMTEAKLGGGSRYVIFEPQMQQRAARRSGIEADLRVAVDEAQLFVVYQPVVGLNGDAAIDRFAGVEALVRWRHPTRGIVAPAEFIGVAEECGLIAAIGEFVLRTSCRQFVAWQRELGAAAPRTLAVNLSRAQLGQPAFIDSVRDILRSCGMNPQQLQLEVTESLAAQDEMIQSRLRDLKSLGLKLALDDFGTGYSSLASLHLLPVDTIKIDRSFVSQADSSRHHRVLVEATIRVAHSLGMSTVAEGIETAAQAAAVRQLCCEKGQGYFFAKPLPAADLARWLAAPSRDIAAQPRDCSDKAAVRGSQA